ncbi:hypothetical protein BXU06_15430 [Aquaspirillum sp. LM1]|uniref:hypothetical protein n=1 Tax=Aquaspirillum sp. LM1 TaxID=1938604 RepID=UPI000983F8A5|nr:hypothetical protein [Aquaspirillum sp. LM1]AQR66278.1 hypothetical protein BXU06_15430 [Aquaspirillum sp. LM1]
MPFLRLTALWLALAAASASAQSPAWGIQLIVGQPPVYRVQSPVVVYPAYPVPPRQREYRHPHHHDRDRYDYDRYDHGRRDVPPGWQRPPGWNDHPSSRAPAYGREREEAWVRPPGWYDPPAGSRR